MHVIATPNSRSPCHFPRLIFLTVYLKMYISEFCWYRWPKARSILRPLHYKSMVENWKAPLLDEAIRSTLKHRFLSRIDTLNRNIATSGPSPCRQGHFRLFERSPTFVSAITFVCSDWLYGSTDMHHDLFRSGHDLDLRSNFNLDF